MRLESTGNHIIYALQLISPMRDYCVNLLDGSANAADFQHPNAEGPAGASRSGQWPSLGIMCCRHIWLIV